MIHAESAPGQGGPTLCGWDGGRPDDLRDGDTIQCSDCRAILAAFGRLDKP
jgi:hypothetical protein